MSESSVKKLSLEELKSIIQKEIRATEPASLAPVRTKATETIERIARMQSAKPEEIFKWFRVMQGHYMVDPHIWAQELRKAYKMSPELELHPHKRLNIKHAIDMYMGLGEGVMSELGGADGSSPKVGNADVYANSSEPKKGSTRMAREDHDSLSSSVKAGAIEAQNEDLENEIYGEMMKVYHQNKDIVSSPSELVETYFENYSQGILEEFSVEQLEEIAMRVLDAVENTDEMYESATKNLSLQEFIGLVKDIIQEEKKKLKLLKDKKVKKESSVGSSFKHGKSSSLRRAERNAEEEAEEEMRFHKRKNLNKQAASLSKDSEDDDK